MANARVATGAILSTVTDTANAVSGVVNTISGGLDMLNSFVRHNQAKQRIDQLVDTELHKERLMETIALETAERKNQIAQALANPELVDYYNETYAKLNALLNPKEG